VRPVEEQHPRPEVDRVLVPAREIPVEAVHEQRFRAAVAIGSLGGGNRIEAFRLGHVRRSAQKYIGACSEVQEGSGRILHRHPPGVVQIRPMAVIECIPNVSEGRRADVLDAMGGAIRAAGARLLDVKPDATHHRTVFTFAGEPAAVEAAVLALYDRALQAVDLRQHKGEHPRLGAVDVVPFVPIEGVTMADCVALAKKVGAEIARRFNLPVFLYEEAASSPARRNLEDIRRGEFEGLAAKLSQPAWQPDFGPAAPHVSAGATVIGARTPLIAYNINLATNRLDVAKKIAAAVRQSSGGLRFVKAMGIDLADRGIVQVSMNLTNYEKTPVFRVFELVKREAARYGVSILESEIVGLIPSAALTDAAAWYLQVEGFSGDQILENKLK
jgi:glutamate formiminotransferase / 5-formyltetrahydrofolate cyclo-ligase